MRGPLGWRVWLSGASSGLGAALARELQTRACRLALFARRHDLLTALRDELVSMTDEESLVLAQQGDVTDRDRVHAAVHEAERAFGGLDLLLLNAGTGESLFPRSFDALLVERILKVNFLGAIYGIEAGLPAMLERGHGMIAATSSISAVRGMPTAAPYCASKAALTTFLESLRIDLHGTGIRVTTISPGFVKTPLTDRNRFPMPFLQNPENAARRIVRGLEKGRREIHFPRRMTIPMKCLRLLPGPIFDGIMRRLTAGKGYGKAPS